MLKKVFHDKDFTALIKKLSLNDKIRKDSLEFNREEDPHLNELLNKLFNYFFNNDFIEEMNYEMYIVKKIMQDKDF